METQETEETTEVVDPKEEVLERALKAMDEASPEPEKEASEEVEEEGQEEETEEGGEEEVKADDGEEIDTPASKRLSFIARKEAAVREKEAAIEEERQKALAEANKVKEENQGLVQQAQRIVQNAQYAVSDPVHFFREMFQIEGAALEPIAKALYYSAVGQEAPADTKNQIGLTRLERQMQQVLQQNQQLQQQLQTKEQERAYYDQGRAYKARVEDFVSTLPDTFEHLQSYVGHQKDEVVTAFLEEAAAELDNGAETPPSPKEVAEKLEAQLAEDFEKKYGSRYVKATETKKNGQKKVKKAAPVLSERELATPTKHKGPPKDDEERLQRALERWEETERNA